MSLKDAIREAAGERDKQSNVQSKAPQSAQSENPEQQPEPQDEGTKGSKAVNTASNKAAFTANSKTVNADSNKAARKNVKQADIAKNETAAMTVRVSKRHRLHWLIAAKREGTSLTAAITEALNARFGEPAD